MVHTHIDPCNRIYCTECPLANCTIRTVPFKAQQPFSITEVTRKDLN